MLDPERRWTLKGAGSCQVQGPARHWALRDAESCETLGKHGMSSFCMYRPLITSRVRTSARGAGRGRGGAGPRSLRAPRTSLGGASRARGALSGSGQSRSGRGADRAFPLRRQHAVPAAEPRVSARHVHLTPAPLPSPPRPPRRPQDDPAKEAQRVVRLAAGAARPRRQDRQPRLHTVRRARGLGGGAAAALQPQDAAEARAGGGLAAGLRRAAGAGRRHRRRHGGAHGDPAVAGLRQHRGPAAAVRAVRLVPGLLRVHRAGRLPRRAGRAHGHRLAADVAGGGRRGGEGRAAQPADGAGGAADGRAGAGLPHQLRVGPRVLGVHVGGGADDRHLAGEGPVRHPRDRHYVPAAVDLHLPEHPQRRAVGPRAGLRVHRAAAVHAENRHDQAGRVQRRGPQYEAEGSDQGHVAAGHLPQRHSGGGGRRARGRRGGAGLRPRAADGGHPVRRARAAPARHELRARRQLHGRLPGHGVGDGLGTGRHPAHRAAGGHRHLQGVLRRPHHRRHAGDDRARRGQRGQLLHAGVPGRRLAGALRGLQRLRRQDPLQRTLHRGDGDRGAAVLHAVLRVHPEGGAGGRHHLRHPVHGGVRRRQADVARQEAGPDPGHRHVRAVPHAAHRARHPHGRRGQHHLHPVPRRAAQVLRGDAEDGAGRGVRDDHAGPLPHVPVRGLRAAAGDQERWWRRHARGAGVHAHLQRRLHRRQEHRAANRRLPRAPAAALLLQRQALRVLHLRGRHQARALRGVLRGRGAGPPAGRRPAPGAQAAAAAAAAAAARLPRLTRLTR